MTDARQLRLFSIQSEISEISAFEVGRNRVGHPGERQYNRAWHILRTDDTKALCGLRQRRPSSPFRTYRVFAERHPLGTRDVNVCHVCVARIRAIFRRVWDMDGVDRFILADYLDDNDKENAAALLRRDTSTESQRTQLWRDMLWHEWGELLDGLAVALEFLPHDAASVFRTE